MIENFKINLIDKNDSLLLGISGGIDSMVLFDIILKLKDKMNLKIYVAHIDHQKRSSSKDDREFVIERSEEYNIPCFVEMLETNYEENFHDYAHKKRHEFFYKIAKDNDINKVVLAHNANDNAETILMRLTRGSSFEGYRGILEKSYYKDLMIIRPLINTSRKSIEVYQQANLVPYQSDPSNESDDYTRNRYRHHLLPILENENPKYLDKLSQFSNYQSLGYDLIDDISQKYIAKNLNKDDYSIDIDNLKEQYKIIQIEVIKRVINIITNNSLELSYQNFIDILELLNNNKSYVEFSLENKLYIFKSYKKLYFKTEPQVRYDFKINLTDFKEYSLPNGYLVNITKKPNKNYGFLYKLCYNNLDLVFPLTVRNRRDGDRVNYNFGSKKVKDILIDKKIPHFDRDLLPIFIDKNDEILFIPGIYNKTTEGENELYIQVQKKS
ncbi:MAG: tRNA lysidine(34) synthetase TilS [Candidatus Izemoplasmatales bacterium]|nr:tRNA lysidine(34) synthetase TilS [Candidatus Izemoplasmatales bacterium]